MPELENQLPWKTIKTEAQAREDFIRESQPFIRHVAVQAVQRSLEWGRDEELSEALLAFNEAIDYYDEEREVPFLAYARMIIKRRLIDYYRREKNHRNRSIDDEEGVWGADILVSLNEFSEQEQNKERALEIGEYSAKLAEYELSFNDLVDISPKHKDSRATLLKVGRILAQDQEMWQQVLEKKKLPMQALSRKTQVHAKVLERGRKYILAVALIIANKHDFIYLREYVIPKKGKMKNES